MILQEMVRVTDVVCKARGTIKQTNGTERKTDTFDTKNYLELTGAYLGFSHVLQRLC